MDDHVFVPYESNLGQALLTYSLCIVKHKVTVNYADDNTLGSRGETLDDCSMDVKTDIKSAINWYDDFEMQVNASKFQFTNINMDRTQTRFSNVNLLV